MADGRLVPSAISHLPSAVSVLDRVAAHPVPLPPGLRRLAIRVDGGAWLAPAGTRRVFDEFGSEVGLLIVP